MAGGLNLGGSVEPLANAVGVVEAAVERGAGAVLVPVSARRHLFDLSDDMATRVNLQFYGDARDALFKACWNSRGGDRGYGALPQRQPGSAAACRIHAAICSSSSWPS